MGPTSIRSRVARCQLVGFDLRENPTAACRHWDPARKDRYLLRLDVDEVVSTDAMVLPSVALNVPGWHGVVDHWSDLDELRGHAGVAANAAADAPWIVAVAVVWESIAEDRRDAWPRGRLVATRPAAPSEEWEMLGYDVSDEWLPSGLSNCGYEPGEKALRRRWAPRLNRHHLFDDVDDALAFKVVTDARVPKHAPFQVFGVFRVPSDS